MSRDKYILIGHSIDFEDVGEALTQNREVVYFDYDEKTWEDVGRKITISQYDEMTADWKNWEKYRYGTFFADVQVIKNGGVNSIPKGKYDFWLVDRVI